MNLAKMVFLSSKSDSSLLFCPLFRGLFLFKSSPLGEVSYKVKKNVPWHIPAPSAVACDSFLLRASAHPAERF